MEGAFIGGGRDGPGRLGPPSRGTVTFGGALPTGSSTSRDPLSSSGSSRSSESLTSSIDDTFGRGGGKEPGRRASAPLFPDDDPGPGGAPERSPAGGRALRLGGGPGGWVLGGLSWLTATLPMIPPRRRKRFLPDGVRGVLRGSQRPAGTFTAQPARPRPTRRLPRRLHGGPRCKRQALLRWFERRPLAGSDARRRPRPVAP